VERARLAWERARAGAIPNVTVGGGYALDNVDQTAGWVITVETPLPFWDRKQGQIQAARAEWARAQATVRSTATRLDRDLAEAWGRYEGTRREVERLQAEVLPRVERTARLLRQGFEAGSPGVSFTDVLLTVHALNTTQVNLAQARRNLWLAVADLAGLMQLSLGEERLEPAAH
jgi:cobalt-zinc-cadmium efflux system outer membrane protein